MPRPRFPLAHCHELFTSVACTARPGHPALPPPLPRPTLLRLPCPLPSVVAGKGKCQDFFCHCQPPYFSIGCSRNSSVPAAQVGQEGGGEGGEGHKRDGSRQVRGGGALPGGQQRSSAAHA